MFEQFPSPESHENAPITKEQVLNALKTNGKEHAPTMQLLVAWIDQNRNEIRSIGDPIIEQEETIIFEIEKAELYFEAGFVHEALEELEELKDVAYDNPDLYEQIDVLIEKIKMAIVSLQEMVVMEKNQRDDIDDTSLEGLSLSELNKKLNNAESVEDYELAAQIRDEINKRLVK